MKTDSITISIHTSLPKEDIYKICLDSFRTVGGSTVVLKDSFEINQGSNGLSHDNLYVLNTSISVREVIPTTYEIICNMKWKTSPTFWNYFILGILIYFILWPWLIINFNKVKPRTIYEPVLINIKTQLEDLK